MSNLRFPPPASPSDTSSPATLTRRVYEMLREEILSGQLTPGQRLVRRAIAQRLGVSPIPVTEALLRLEVEGLVESRPLCGCRVRPLELEDVQNEAMLREAIECQAARLCAERVAGADLTRLAAEAKRLDRMVAGRDPHSRLGRQAHLEFHVNIARAGGFPRLAEELQRVWFRRLMWMNWVKATHYQPVPRAWHQQLVEALATRDADRAEAQMRAHVRYGREDDRAALEYLFQEQNGGELWR
jgi:DNA-binding GntR family transcriptional regulator